MAHNPNKKDMIRRLLLRGICHRFTPRARVSLILGAMFGLVLALSSFLLYQQNSLAVRGSELAVHAHKELVRAIQLRESLAEIDRHARVGEIQSEEIVRFQRALEHAHSKSGAVDYALQAVISSLRKNFESYIAVLSASRAANRYIHVRANYEDVAASVGTLIELRQGQIYRMAEDLRILQNKTLMWVLGFLLLFTVVLIWAGYRVISAFTAPLLSLVKYLDDHHFDKGTSKNSGRFFFSKSYDAILERLKSYSELNVNRLLFEKKRADLIASSISDGIFLLQGTEIVYSNPVGERLLRHEHSIAESLTKAISRTIPVEFVFKGADGDFYFLVQAYPVMPEMNDEPAKEMANLGHIQPDMMVVARDVTIVKESQEAKSHFIATLSHEVKTPITSLTMATRLLKRSIEDFKNPTHQSLIKTCVEDVDRLRGLLDDLLTISRFETLTQRLEIQSVDLGKLLRHAVQTFSSQSEEKGIELRVHSPPSGRAVFVPMDPTKIAWALSNLLLNAIRHSPRGSLVVAKLEISEDSDFAEVRICDSGPGIDRQRQKKIFEKFSAHYDIRVARSGSAGVGLAITREIVTAHGGQIWVSSRPGEGAEFCFSLPLRRSAIRPDGNGTVVETIVNLKGAKSGTFAGC